jgi:O-antigen/teichoic acid export membrane protein
LRREITIYFRGGAQTRSCEVRQSGRFKRLLVSIVVVALVSAILAIVLVLGLSLMLIIWTVVVSILAGLIKSYFIRHDRMPYRPLKR